MKCAYCFIQKANHYNPFLDKMYCEDCAPFASIELREMLRENHYKMFLMGEDFDAE